MSDIDDISNARIGFLDLESCLSSCVDALGYVQLALKNKT